MFNNTTITPLTALNFPWSCILISIHKNKNEKNINAIGHIVAATTNGRNAGFITLSQYTKCVFKLNSWKAL